MSVVHEFLSKPHSNDWHNAAESFLNETIRSRYGARALAALSVRSPLIQPEKAPFAALLHKDSPTSGGYGGTSFVIFPSTEGSFFSLGVGTQGLAPDEDILSRPGHARFCRAFASWANSLAGEILAWAKTDPTRTDLNMPPIAKESLDTWEAAIKRYGNVLYTVARRTEDKEMTEQTFFALLDFYLAERGYEPLTTFKPESLQLRTKILATILTSPSRHTVLEVLRGRRFVILQGPPGTGKTRMANTLLERDFSGNGASYQLHPSTSYEQFVGGIAPVEVNGTFGFRPLPGILMSAAVAAARSDRPYLLHLDEVNRADLARVLGEALFLFEVQRSGENTREIQLAHDFGENFGHSLTLPANLYVLGTMNSADRSTAILDLAIRRRFAFLSMWPDRSALVGAPEIAIRAFERLFDVFVNEASDEALELMPGHSYFLAASEAEARMRLTNELRPLLITYLRQGLVPSIAEPLDAYLQWLGVL